MWNCVILFFLEMKTVLVKIGSLQFICTGFSISTKSRRLATIWFDVLVNLATIWFIVVMMLVQGLHDNADKATVIINFNKSSQSLHTDENWEAQRFSNNTSKWFIESKAATRRKVVTYEPMVDAISCYDRPLEHLT